MRTDEARWVAIAKTEATPAGYRKYAPITKGPFIAAGGLAVFAVCVPFYMAWCLILNRITSAKKP